MRRHSLGASFACLCLLTSLAMVTAPAAAGGRGNDKDGNKIYDDLDQAMKGKSSDAFLDAIIVFSGGESANEIAAARRDVGAFEVKYEYRFISGAAARLTVGQIRSVAARSRTTHVQLDAPVEAFLDTARASSGVDKVFADFGADGNNGSSLNCPGVRQYCKDDVVVSVIDTGIDGSHVDLNGGKVLGFANCYQRDPCEVRSAFDDNGHGTHVSSMIAGEGAESGDGESRSTTRSVRGVAPGAALVGVKVLNQRGSGSMSDVDRGIEWTISNRSTFGIEALNLSLGTSGCSDGADSSSLLVNQAFSNGIVPFVAAGNSGPKLCTIGSPGAAANAVTVGALADPGDTDESRPPGFSLASFSSRGPTADNRQKPDIAAPGVDILAAKANSGNGYVVYSGTSMATPFTAGVAALMLDVNPVLTPTDVKSLLMGTAVDWGPNGADYDYGAGRLDAYAAVKAAGSLAGTGPAVPTHEFHAGSLGSSETNDFFDIAADTTAPIAVTFVMPNWSGSSSPDFDLYLLDPSGNTVAQSTGTSRQETIGYRPSTAGTYKLRVHRYAGTGDYWFDLSYAASAPAVPNTAPVLDSSNPTSAGVLEGGSADVAVAATDAESCLTFSVTAVTNGSATVTQGTCSGSGPYSDGAKITYSHDGSETTSGNFTYRATDEQGAYAEATVSVSVSPVNDAPTASFTYSCDKLACNFFGSATDADSTTLSYSWDFGDTSTTADTSTAQSPAYTYPAEGTYTVTLTATDDAGASDVATQAVTVSNTTAPSELTAAAFKNKGLKWVELRWTKGSAATVDIYRNGALLVTAFSNDGFYKDDLNRGGTFTYKVCITGSTTHCSNEATTSF